MKLSWGARLYIVAVATGAVGLLLFWLVAWPIRAPESLALVLVLGCQGVALTHVPVLVSPRFKVDATPAIYFACLLLLGPPEAMAVVGASRLIGELTMMSRRDPVSGRRLATPQSAVFNSSQMMLMTGVAGLVYMARPIQLMSALSHWEGVAQLVAAATVMYASSELAVAGIASIQTTRDPLAILRQACRMDLLENGTLYVAGFLVALVSLHRPWVALVLTLPAAVVVFSLRKSVQMVEQTVAALEAMADVVDRRDPYTYEHSRRVALSAVRIARRLGLAEREIDTIRLAARVHDLGKIGLPDSVLLKEGRLTEEEFALMRTHPEVGAAILATFPTFRRGRDLVLRHHERLDGLGYPGGLRGHEIPTGARVIAVADAFDAMTSARPYREALTMERVMNELRLGRGTQWSEDAVDALIATTQGASGRAGGERVTASPPSRVPAVSAQG
ncbi:MAG: HD-GYP domain-containing protein [Candidatus Dormibacteraceae bacterium]